MNFPRIHGINIEFYSCSPWVFGVQFAWEHQERGIRSPDPPFLQAEQEKGSKDFINMGSICIFLIFPVGGRNWEWFSPAALTLKQISSDFSFSGVIWDNFKYLFGDGC